MDTIQEDAGSWPMPSTEDMTASNDSLRNRRPSGPSLRTHIESVAKRNRRPSLPNIQSAVTAGFTSSATPPETPEHQDSFGDVHALPQSLFHNYLRALHAFDPQSGAVSGEDATLMNASIKEGDLILIHCIHANGWADGTVLNTGERGWLPTNYCEAYDHPYIRNLLNAMTQFWDLLGASEDANLSTFVRQDYIRGLIAGVRYLLEHTDCLHRDATQVKQHVGTRRMRKGLLADLSSLVQIAKRLQETISEPFAGEVMHVLLEDLITKAFKVVTRAVSFVDVWTQETSRVQHPVTHLMVPQAPDTPPVDSTLPFRASRDSTSSPLIDSAVDMPAQPSEKGGRGNDDVPSKDEERVKRASAPRVSLVFTPPDGHAAHRLSLVGGESSGGALSGPLASEQLAKAYDMCIGHIAAFIGHHLHSRPSSELIPTTERLIEACASLSAIVEEVQAHDMQNSAAVQHARKEFQLKVDELANSTKEVFRFSDSPEDEAIMLPNNSQHLVGVGTELIHKTGQCVEKTRQLIESFGDFELQHTAGPSQGVVPERPATAGASAADEETSNAQDSPAVFSSPARHPRWAKRVSSKMLPPPPLPPLVPKKDILAAVESTDFAQSSAGSTFTFSPATPDTPNMRQSLPPPQLPPVQRVRSATRVSQSFNASPDKLKSPESARSQSRSPARNPARNGSVDVLTSRSTDTFFSARDSSITTGSEASTRATTPEHSKEASTSPDPAVITSFASMSSMRSLGTDAGSDAEAQLLQKTYANELTFNKDGQVTGGSLPALVEQLSMHNSAPDPLYVKAFFITFRKFTEPREFAQALIARFDYVGENKTVGTPVRLRIFNIFKHWLETYWSTESDKDALGDIRYFALHKLKTQLPSAGERLVEITRRVAAAYRDGSGAPTVGRMTISSVRPFDGPEPAVNKHDLNMLRVANGGGAPCSITDFDPVEIARQITVLTGKIYCTIQPGELLSMDWGKSNTKKARNVRRMCLMNTDLAHLVGDSILAPEDPKKRANVIKQWGKVATECLELNNFDSVMSIMCTINSSVVKRLKKTWEQLSKKSRAKLEELDQVCDMSKNYSALRKRLESPTMPSVPFLGIFLTDLTFVIAGNPKRREIPGSTAEDGKPVSVINFDMYQRIARIISHLQKFQTPYALKDVPEMQIWLETHLRRMRDGHDQMVGTLHRRSLFLEPKSDDRDRKQSMAVEGARKMSIAQEGMRSDDSERPRTAAGMFGNAQHAMLERFDFYKKGAF